MLPWPMMGNRSPPSCRMAQSPFASGSAGDHVPGIHPRITIQSERGLTMKIVARENIGFSDTVEEAVVIREGLVMLSWREHIGSTIVHVLDCLAGEAYPPQRRRTARTCERMSRSKCRGSHRAHRGKPKHPTF